MDKIRCSVGVTAYNEEANIGQLLAALIDQHLHEVEIVEIIVVASACTDRTVEIVKETMVQDARVKLIEQAGEQMKQSTRLFADMFDKMLSFQVQSYQQATKATTEQFNKQVAQFSKS